MKESILNFIKKYPLTFISVIVLAVLCTLMVNLGAVYTSNDYTDGLAECLRLTSSIVSGSFLFSKIITVHGDKIPSKIKSNKIIESLIAIIIITILHFFAKFLIRINSNQNDIFPLYTLNIIFVSLTYYLIIKETKISVPEYTLKVFMNILALFLFECIVASGIAILFYIYYTFFDSADWQILLNILVFLLTIISCIGGFIAVENINSTPGLFAKILVKYVMMIMVLIGFGLFYIYLIKIIIEIKIPSNQVFMVCTILFSLGLSTNLMASFFKDNTPYDLVNKYFPLAFIPALILQMFSLFLRINQYGLTESRYMGIIIIIFEVFYIILYQFNYDKLRCIFIVDIVLILIMCYVPLVNMYQFPNIYNKLTNKDLIDNEYSMSNFNSNEDDKEKEGQRTANISFYKNIQEINIEGYRLLRDADIHIEYNNKEKIWQNYNQTSKKISDFTSVNVIDNDSNVITTIDISNHLEKIKESIIAHNFSNDIEEIMKDIPDEIINDNLKYIITNTNVKYNEELGVFTEVIFWGRLLTK